MEAIAPAEDEEKLFALQMETFAAFADHTDNEVGRLVDAIDEIGALENTVFILELYICISPR